MKTFSLICFLLPFVFLRAQSSNDSICLETHFRAGYYQLCAEKIKVRKETIFMETNIPIVPGDSITSYRYIWFYTDNLLNGYHPPGPVAENALLLKFSNHQLKVNGSDFTGTIRIAHRRVFRGVENVHSTYVIREFRFEAGKPIETSYADDIRLNPSRFEMY